MNNSAMFIRIGRNLSSTNKSLRQKLYISNQSILLDVSSVENTNVATLSFIFQTQKKLKKHGHTLALISPSSCLRTWLYITKLHNLIPSFPNLTLANAYIQTQKNTQL